MTEYEFSRFESWLSAFIDYKIQGAFSPDALNERVNLFELRKELEEAFGWRKEE